jgi:hypothetical protein
MVEILLVVGSVGALIAGGLVVMFAPGQMVMTGGAAIVALGLLLGVPTGLVYHVLLGEGLSRGGPPPERWWWRPLQHHEDLSPADLDRVLPWCYAGAAGFGCIMLGCGVVALGTFLLGS